MARTAPDADVALETLPDRPAASAAATDDPDQGVSTPMSTTLHPTAETPTPHHTAPEVPLGSTSVHLVPLPTHSPQCPPEPRCHTLPCLSDTLTSPTTRHDQLGTCTVMVPPSGARDDAASSTLHLRARSMVRRLREAWWTTGRHGRLIVSRMPAHRTP